MFKKKIQFCFSCSSLILVFFTFVFICYAWYTTNQNAEIEGILAQTNSKNITDISLKRYLAEEVATDSYNLGQELSQIEDESILSFQQKGTHSKIIYEISFCTPSSYLNIEMYTNTSSFDASIYEEQIQDEIYYYNYLSNIAIFSYLKKQDDVLKTDVFPIESEEQEVQKNFSFDKKIKRENKIRMAELKDLSFLENQENRYSVYFLFDYHEYHIQKIFSYNLGINHAKEYSVYFKEDISFLLGAVW